MNIRYAQRLTMYARYTGMATNPEIVIEDNACYAPIMIGRKMLVGDMWLVNKWPEL